MAELAIYFEGRRISEEACRAMENTGAAHVAYGASGGYGSGDRRDIPGHDGGPYLVLARGPGNGWLETLEGNCPHCGCAARLHLLGWDRPVIAWLKARDPLTSQESWVDVLAAKKAYRIQCQGCNHACHEMPPHADADQVLQKF